jgi:hypothetical protein
MILNGPISQVGTPELSHQATNIFYVDNRLLSYNTTGRLNTQFEALYAKKTDLQTTNLRMLTLLHTMSQTTVPDPFAFLEYYVTFLLRETLVLPFIKSIAYHVDPVASWSFEPPLTCLDTVVNSLVMPENTWIIGVMSKPDLLACGFTIQRGHPLDTIAMRRAADEQFTNRV